MKKLLFLLAFALQGYFLAGQYTVNFQLLESLSGGCGFHTNCVTQTVCYDLYGTPSVNGAWLASYDIWFVLNNGSGNEILYSSDGTCIIMNNTDLPPSGATTYIRVGASQGNSTNVLNGSTLLHNFCITYSTIGGLNGSTIVVGGSFSGFNSNMSVNVGSTPTDAVLVPTTLTISSSNTSCDPLPVKWLSFVASKKNNNSMLNWATGQELNNDGFIVERSSDQRNFEKIGEISAVTEQDVVNSYSFIDFKPLNGVNYYRIKQFDFDGQYDYSPIRSLQFTNREFSVQVWPNPVNTLLNIQITGSEEESVVLKLFNSTGQVIQQQYFESSILNSFLDVSDVQPGLYTLLVETPLRTFVEKVIIVK
ncbi:MAG: T9SS type A sorting domain-containing protein [Saprospiraceae bacterium]